MSRELIGKANHVFDEDEIASIDVHTSEVETQEDVMKPFVTIRTEDGDGDSVLIHSLEQWEQLNALVRKAFDKISE